MFCCFFKEEDFLPDSLITYGKDASHYLVAGVFMAWL